MKYPIIQILENDKNIYAESNTPAKADISLLPIFNNSIILDADGFKYVVKCAYKLRWMYFFGFHPLMKGRTVQIGYEFSEEGKIDLLGFKNFLTSKLSLGVEKKFWYKQKDIPELIKRINGAQNYKQIIDIFVFGLNI